MYILPLYRRPVLICQLLGVFEDEAVMHVENSVDPVRDLEIISDELLQKDIEIMTSHIEPIRRVAKADKTKRGDLDIAEKIFNWLSVEKKEIRLGTWNAKEVSLIVQYKPCYYYLVVFELLSDRLFTNARLLDWLPEHNPIVDRQARHLLVEYERGRLCSPKEQMVGQDQGLDRSSQQGPHHSLLCCPRTYCKY